MIKRFNLLDLIQGLAGCNDIYLHEAGECGESEICEVFVNANNIVITIEVLCLL